MTEDIQNYIIANFHLEAQAFVFSIIDKIYQHKWGVGQEQLAMSLLKLSNGSVDKLLTYFPIIDPRDIINEAIG